MLTIGQPATVKEFAVALVGPYVLIRIFRLLDAPFLRQPGKN
jgi:hypothetical protein